MLTFFASALEGLSRLDTPPQLPKRSELFADTLVTDQFGERFRFRSDLVEGRAVVINTMFTVCRGSCPTTSGTLQRLRKPLGTLFGKRVTLLSLSLDPATDTTANLRAYASSFGAGERAGRDESDWHFLRAEPEETEHLRRSLGFFDLNPAVDADITQHAALLLFGNDQANRWATSPVRLRDGLLLESLRRILGETTEERFGFRR